MLQLSNGGTIAHGAQQVVPVGWDKRRGNLRKDSQEEYINYMTNVIRLSITQEEVGREINMENITMNSWVLEKVVFYHLCVNYYSYRWYKRNITLFPLEFDTI
jgi:hypothetical protein